MLYGGNALSDLLDNVFIVEAGKSAPGYLWRCLPLDLALHTSSLDLIDVLFCWFLKHIELQWVLARDRTTVGGCCKSLSSGDYNYVTGINYITNIRTDTLHNHHHIHIKILSISCIEMIDKYEWTHWLQLYLASRKLKIMTTNHFSSDIVRREGEERDIQIVMVM